MVSVITITYNRAHLIGEAIRSVLSQSYSDFEYLIMDDGSEDDTESVVRSFNDSRIIYRRIDHSGKIAFLRNQAMKLARGEFIAFVDSDDLWMNEKLQQQLDAIKNDSSDFSFCEAEIFTSKKIVFPFLYDKHDLPSTGNYFLPLISDVKFVLFPSTVLFKTACLSKTGYLNEEHESGDKEFLCHLTLTFKGSFVNKKLVRIRRHEENVTHDFEHVKGILEDELKTTHHFYSKGAIDKRLYRKLSARFQYKLAEHLFHAGRFSQATNHYSTSLKLNPLNWKAIAKIIISLSKS